jgi:phosphopantothenoylcysteine decarboxylase/phosphopantothenate--cysteine ligase
MSQTEVLVGVTGGIAAFKTAALVSKLVQADFAVTVIQTKASTEFVGPATFAALTGRPVAGQMFDEQRYPLGAHIELAQRAALLCVAPASADFLARIANGAASDLLATTYLCFRGPVLVAPAMNDRMWEQPAVQRNIQQLERDGVSIIPPGEGWLSCRQRGAGRMAEPVEILAKINSTL